MSRRAGLVVVLLFAVAACGDSGVPNAPAVPTTGPDVPSSQATPTSAPNVPSSEAVPSTIPSGQASPTTIPSGQAVPTTLLQAVVVTTTTPAIAAPPIPVAFPDDPLAAFQAWLQAVNAGDVDAAVALTGPFTLSELAGINLDNVHFELQEGWGEWHEAADAVFHVSDIDEAALISLRGTVTQEGMTDTRAIAMPMVKDPDDAGNWKVEWLPGSSFVTWTQTRLDVCATGVPTFQQRIYIDGTEQTPAYTDDGNDETVTLCTTLADSAEHTVAVVFLGDVAGAYSAAAYLAG